MSESTTQDLFEMFQKMMNPMAFPFQHLVMPSLSVEEVDKKLADLKAVRSWLNTSLSMVDLSIKGLEYQRVLLEPGSEKPSKHELPPNPFLDPKLWNWNPFEAQSGGAPPARAADPKRPTRKKKPHA
jgi:hypothetical protein